MASLRPVLRGRRLARCWPTLPGIAGGSGSPCCSMAEATLTAEALAHLYHRSWGASWSSLRALRRLPPAMYSMISMGGDESRQAPWNCTRFWCALMACARQYHGGADSGWGARAARARHALAAHLVGVDLVPEDLHLVAVGDG